MAQERMANFGQFQKLYDYFTSPDGGMNPVQASGMLGNIYAESKGNPMALNPGDGSDGTDSVGLIQHNSSRAVALREFAANRGEGADMLMSNAMFITEEGRGAEARGYGQGMAGETPEDAALGFAQGYIRPAAQHIPQRAGYGRMMYDTFAGGGDPNEALAPGLSYSPQQGEDLANNAEEVDKASRGTGYKLNGGIDDPMMARLYGLSNQQDLSMGQAPQPQGPQNNMYPIGQSMAPPQIDTGSPMQGDSGGALGPTQERAMPQIITSAADVPVQQEQPGMPAVSDAPAPLTFADPTSNGTGSTYDNSHPGSRIKPEEMLAMLPSADELDELVPTPEGQPNVSEQIDANLYPLGVSAAEAVGADPAEAPTSMAEVADAITNSEPTEEDDEEAAAKKKRRYAMAANMLETLSVGLGQISAGEAVDVGSVLQNQSQRRFDQQEYDQEAGATAREAAQQQVAAQSLAQQLNASGEPELAQLALSGPDGFKEALGSYGTIMSRAPTASETGVDPEKDFYDKTPQQRFDALKASGVSDEDASIGAKEPGLGYQLLADFGDRVKSRSDAAATAALTATDEARNVASSQAMIDAAIPYRGDKAVKSAMAALAANPQDNAARSALQNAIVDVDEDAVLPGEDMSPMLLDGLIRQAGSSIDPSIAEAARSGDTRAQKMVEEAADAAATEGGKRTGQVRADAAGDREERTAQADAAVNSGLLSPALKGIVETSGIDAGMEAQKVLDVENRRKTDATNAQTLAHNVATIFTDPRAAALFSDVTSEEGLRIALSAAEEKYGLTEEVKTALMASSDPAVRNSLIALNAATSGKTMSVTQQTMLENQLEELNVEAQGVATTRPLIEGMRRVQDLVTQDGYETSGPISGTVGAAFQSVLTDVLGPEAEGMILNNQESFINRQVMASVGNYFSNFRATGAGATSDMESNQFMNVMPRETDSPLKQAGLAQRIIRDGQKEQRILQLRQKWMLDNDGNPDKQLDREAMSEYVDKGIGSMNLDTFPAVNQRSSSFADEFQANIDSNNITERTVIRVEGDGTKEPYYVVAKDYVADIMGMPWDEFIASGDDQ
jgi:hypothetical protein